jgi:hypothetical protein
VLKETVGPEGVHGWVIRCGGPGVGVHVSCRSCELDRLIYRVDATCLRDLGKGPCIPPPPFLLSYSPVKLCEVNDDCGGGGSPSPHMFPGRQPHAQESRGDGELRVISHLDPAP